MQEQPSSEKQEYEMRKSFMVATQNIVRSEDRFRKNAATNIRMGLKMEYSKKTIKLGVLSTKHDAI